MKHDILLRKFTASQAEQITGAPMAIQRDYRRKGFLPEISGHSRLDAFALCRLWMLKIFVDSHIKPSAAIEAAHLCAFATVSRALQSSTAFEHDDQNRSYTSITADELKELRIQAIRATGDSPAPKHLKTLLSAPRFFVWWSEAEMTWGDRLDPLFDGLPVARPNQSAIVIDLHRQANDLLRLAGPIVDIKPVATAKSAAAA